MVVSTYMSSIDSTIINDAIAYAEELFRTNAGGHDAEHTMRVYRNTLRIAATEPDCDIRIAALAALLHDVDDHKLFATVDNANARAFLEAHSLPQETIERICGIINSVSFSRNKDRRPSTPEGKVVQDADRHNKEVQANRKQRLPQKMPTHYQISLHIDDEDNIIKNSHSFGYRAYRVYEPDENWVQKVLAEAERIRGIEKLQHAHAQKQQQE